MTTSTAKPAFRLNSSRWSDVLRIVLEYLGLMVALVGLIGYFGLTSRGFLSRDTFTTIANQIPPTVIVAIGMTYVLIIAGIDLSVGSVMAFSGGVLGVLMEQYHWRLPVAILAALATGLLCGLLNGSVTIYWRLPSFIVTLGMLEIARGMAHIVTHGQTQYVGSTLGVVAELKYKGLSLPFFICIGAVVLGQLVLSLTVFGRYIVAIGTNEEAVRLAGVDPRPVKIAVFCLIGLLTAVAAISGASVMQSADPNAGVGLELQVIAATVVGGTSLMGGRGSVVRSFLGVVIIAVLVAGLAAKGVQEETKRVVTGCVIVAAAIVDYYRGRLSGK